MNFDKKIYSLLSIATKAGCLTSGEDLSEKAVKNKKAYIVIIATDASDNTKKMFVNSCKYYDVPIYFYGDKISLGHAIGKNYRASLAILDKGFYESIKKNLELGKGNDCKV